MRDGFVARHEWLGALQGISDAEGGRLFKALLLYSAEGERIKLNGREQLLFSVFAGEIDREKARARAKSQKARESIRKRWDREEIATPLSAARNDNGGDSHGPAGLGMTGEGIPTAYGLGMTAGGGALACESTNVYERIRTNTNVYERIRTNGEGVAREDIYIHSSEDKGLIYDQALSLNPGGNLGNPEEDEEYNNRDQSADARARIVRAWREAFGKRPYPAVVSELVDRYGAMDGGRGAEYVAGAIREAATRSAGDPVAYIHALMADWYGEYEDFAARGGGDG